MNRLFCCLVLMGAALLAPACAKIGPAPAALPNEVVQVEVGGHQLTVEVARTPPAMERGLMFRKSLAPDQGMLFVFPVPGPVAFWMRNTYVPLTVAYLDAGGKILELHDLAPLDETPVPSQSPAVAYAIEAPQGWFAQHQIASGARVTPIRVSWEKLRKSDR